MLLDAILPAEGFCFHISGDIIFATFIAPINTINAITPTNPILDNFFDLWILSSSAAMEDRENKPTIGTTVATKIERFGNSNCEKEEIVSKIRMPEMTVQFAIIISLAPRLDELDLSDNE